MDVFSYLKEWFKTGKYKPYIEIYENKKWRVATEEEIEELKKVLEKYYRDKRRVYMADDYEFEGRPLPKSIWTKIFRIDFTKYENYETDVIIRIGEIEGKTTIAFTCDYDREYYSIHYILP